MKLYNKLKEMKIVLVDDDELIRDSLSLFLESEGCQLQAFATAEEGVEAMKREDFDLIIADYRLPGMNGLMFFKEIQRLNSHAFKILVTAYGNEDVFSEARKIGVADIIEKPFTTHDIERSLTCLFSRSETNSPAGI